MPYHEELQYLYGLERFGMIFGLRNVSELLRHLGDPHLGLQVVHVAGTNGKGSVCAMLHSVLRRRFKVGLYTSPHLHRFNERIRIDHQEIADEEMAELVRTLRSKVEATGRPEHFTFFDFTTAMALFYFAQKGVDLAIVEVGLGGRLDSTNVVRPIVTVITNIGHDHMDVLGHDLRGIAREKAGVIKEGVPVVCGEGKPGPLEVIEDKARERGAPLYLLGRHFHFREDGQKLRFYGRRWTLEGVEVGLPGGHQRFNAALALETLEVLGERGFKVSELEIREGLRGVKWPGRLELFRARPKVLLDGAHNPEGARALKGALKEVPHERLHLVFGIMADKDWKGVLAALLDGASGLVAFRPRTPRALDPEAILQEARRLGLKEARSARGAEEALEQARDMASTEDLILVTGSLFTVAEVREFLLEGG